MDVPDLATFAGLAGATTLIFEVGKRALRWDPDRLDRFGSLIAIGIGLSLALLFSLFASGEPITGESIFAAALRGLFAGMSSMGLYETLKDSPLPVG